MNRVDMSGSVATGSAGPRLSIFGVAVTIVVGVVASFAIMAATGVFDDDREVVTTSAASDNPREIDGILRFTQTNPVDPASEDAILRYAETSLAATRTDDAILRYADANAGTARVDDAILRYAGARPVSAAGGSASAQAYPAADRADDAILRYADSQTTGFATEDAIQRWALNN